MALRALKVAKSTIEIGPIGGDTLSVLDLLPQMIWVMRPDGSYEYFNAAWRDYTGAMSGEAFLGNWLHWVHPDDYQQVLRQWKQCQEIGLPFAEECRLGNKSGEYRWFLIEFRAQQNRPNGLLRWFGSCIDVHEQRIRQSMLEENVKLQRDMLDASVDCIKVIDRDGRLSTMNRAGCVALGVSEDSGFDMDWLNLLPEEVHRLGKPALELARRGENARFPGMSQLSGQEPQYWDNLLSPIKDRTGETSTIVCISRNVTLQREAEMRLRLSEERLRLALESASIGIWDADLVTGTMHCDPQTKAAFGVRQNADVTLQNLVAAAHPEDREQVSIRLEDALNPDGAGKYDIQFRAIGIDDGICRWLVAKGRVSFDEKDGKRSGARFSGTVLDITEQADAERKLLESQNQARELLERTTDAVFMLNSDWEFAYLNPNAVRLIAAGRNLIGKSLWEEFPGVTDREFGKQYRRVMEHGVPVAFEEFYPEPLNKWFDVHAYSMQSGIAVFFRDSTDRKKSEEALIRNEKLAAAGRLAASVSHVINNPLEAVTNLMYLLDTDPSLSQTARGYLDTAQAELARISQIAIQTLQFYKQSTSISEVLLEDQLDTILGFYRSRLHSGSITVLKQYRHHAPITAFEGELRQVFTNLIGNALDALASPGRLFVRTRFLSHEFFGRDYVSVTIADTGTGMAPLTLAKSFEPFFSTKGITGTGLGLWVSKGIIEKHGGKVRVRSRDHRLSHGSVFMVWIPLTVKGDCDT